MYIFARHEQPWGDRRVVRHNRTGPTEAWRRRRRWPSASLDGGKRLLPRDGRRVGADGGKVASWTAETRDVPEAQDVHNYAPAADAADDAALGREGRWICRGSSGDRFIVPAARVTTCAISLLPQPCSSDCGTCTDHRPMSFRRRATTPWFRRATSSSPSATA